MNVPTPFELALLAQDNMKTITGEPRSLDEALHIAWYEFQGAANYIERKSAAQSREINQELGAIQKAIDREKREYFASHHP